MPLGMTRPAAFAKLRRGGQLNMTFLLWLVVSGFIYAVVRVLADQLGGLR
jgi:hypothetical protein